MYQGGPWHAVAVHRKPAVTMAPRRERGHVRGRRPRWCEGRSLALLRKAVRNLSFARCSQR